MADRPKAFNPKGVGNSLLSAAGNTFPYENFSGSAVLMPVHQPPTEPSRNLMAEEDTFVGQSQETVEPKPFSYFNQQNSADPFAQIGNAGDMKHQQQPQQQQQQLPSFGEPVNQPLTSYFGTETAAPNVTSSFPPSQPAVLPSVTFYNAGGVRGTNGHSTTSSYSVPNQTSPPPPQASATANSFRMTKQRPAYVATPGLTTGPVTYPNTASTTVPTVPPQSSEATSEPGSGYSSRPPQMPTSHFQGNPQSVVPPSFNQLAQGNMYQPVPHHWFYCKTVEGKPVWVPFSIMDSTALEDAFNSGAVTPDSLVSVNGGRYDANLLQRQRHSVFWEEEPSEIRRCSWFYKGPLDSQFSPYPEEFAEKLEEEYHAAITTHSWYRRVEIGPNEAVVMHSESAIVHFQPSGTTWGTTTPDPPVRPAVVRRGLEEFTLEQGEPRQVDHLVFIVHGIGSVCDFKFRDIFQTVDDFRGLVLQLLQQHFASASQAGHIGRIEFLPVSWHKTLHGDATGIDRKLKPITLRSIPKLRNFTNDTLLDILFYTSPVYCQTIMDTVGCEINRMHELFKQRNPLFTGGVSLVGHSLGSVILFDMLLHQNPEEKAPFASHTPTSSLEMAPVKEHVEDLGASQVTKSIDELLQQLEIEEVGDILKKEKMDLQSLLLCSEDDLRTLGLPLGPLKKLTAFLAKLNKNDALLKKDTNLHDSLDSSISVSKIVNYTMGLAGTGQPFITYPQLAFQPTAFFALGSPIAMFVTVRGIENLGENFRLPTCPAVFNIFHPFDPVAYRLETMIEPSLLEIRPVLIPHHKGRKRMHLELKETMQRMGADIKQRFFDSLWSTWKTVYQFAQFHKTDSEAMEQEVNKALEEEMIKAREAEETESVASTIEDVTIGQLNGGRRIDYVLQEAPLESFNEYLFAMSSHVCYWESEDTMLLLLREIYTTLGITSDPIQRQSVGSFLPQPSPETTPTLPRASVPLVPPSATPPTFSRAAVPPVPPSVTPPTFSRAPVPLVPPSITPPIQPQQYVPEPQFPPVSHFPPNTGFVPTQPTYGVPPPVIGSRPVSVPGRDAMGMDPTQPLSDNPHLGPPPTSGFVRQGPVGKRH